MRVSVHVLSEGLGPPDQIHRNKFYCSWYYLSLSVWSRTVCAGEGLEFGSNSEATSQW
jgi:hypothetical protein